MRAQNIDILNDPAYSDYVDAFRSSCSQKHAATEVAYIQRLLEGEKDLFREISMGSLALYLNIQGIQWITSDEESMIANYTFYSSNSHLHPYEWFINIDSLKYIKNPFYGR